jgi:hypothetical protein
MGAEAGRETERERERDSSEGREAEGVCEREWVRESG